MRKKTPRIFKQFLPKSMFFGLICLFAASSCDRGTAEKSDGAEAADRGKEIYIANCISCHGPDGKGMNGAYPALVRAEIDENYTRRGVKLISEGSGFANGMKAIALTEDEIADVMNYIQNSWGNKAETISRESVQNFKK